MMKNLMSKNDIKLMKCSKDRVIDLSDNDDSGDESSSKDDDGFFG